MSSTPTPAPAASPGMAAFLSHFNTVAAVAAATIAQEQADQASGASFQQKLNDAVTGAATALAAVAPAWTADIEVGLAAFQTGAAIVTSLFSLFHHKAAPTAAPTSAPPPTSAPLPPTPTPTSAPSGPAVSGAN